VFIPLKTENVKFRVKWVDEGVRRRRPRGREVVQASERPKCCASVVQHSFGVLTSLGLWSSKAAEVDDSDESDDMRMV
jgi:hypothetical protein